MLALRAHGAVKVDITSSTSDRVARFTRKGWMLVDAMPFSTGAQAHAVEQQVLRLLRIEQILETFLTPQQTQGVGESTETFSATDLTALTLSQLVKAATAEMDIGNPENLEQLLAFLSSSWVPPACKVGQGSEAPILMPG